MGNRMSFARYLWSSYKAANDESNSRCRISLHDSAARTPMERPVISQKQFPLGLKGGSVNSPYVLLAYTVCELLGLLR